jgi:hypothetical protein
MELQDTLLVLFSKKEISHITIWRDTDKWYVLKKVPFKEESFAYDIDLVKAIEKLAT